MKGMVMIQIDVDDAVDHLSCMANEIVLVPLNEILRESQKKDRDLLRALIPLVRSLKSLEK